MSSLCVMVSVLDSSAVDRGFEPRSGQTKDYEIGICCFSAKHAALRRKSKYWNREYTCLNIDSSEILVSNIKQIIHNFLPLSEYSVMT
jgi:hypothetical protein